MVRARVRDRYLDLQASRDALASLDAQLDARKDMVGLVNRRVEAGMLSARDLGAERVIYSQLELLRSQELAMPGGLIWPIECSTASPSSGISEFTLAKNSS